MMRWIIASSLHFRFLVLAIALALLFFGALHLKHMPIDVFPEFAPPLVEIQTEAPGMSTSEIESLVTIQLEAAFNSTPGLDFLRSKSVPGLSSIVLIFKPGTDVMLARQLMQERLNIAIRNLPSWAGTPWMLPPLSATSRVMHIGITSDSYSLTDLSMITYWTIRWKLMAVPGVANVVIWGDRFKQLQVKVDPQKLQTHHITLDKVEEVTSEALDYGLLKYSEAAKTRVGGFIETINQRLGIHHVLPIIGPADLAKVPIDETKQKNGNTLTLGDLGQVVWGHQPIIGDGVIGGKRGLLLVVEKFPWANTVNVTQNVDAAIDELKVSLPGINIDPTIFRSADFIDIAIQNLTHSLLFACIFVTIVLALFLYEWRTTLISLIAIPLSLVAGGLLLGLWKTTLDSMVLAGFVIAVGGVVDDAIIDVENIVRRLRQHRETGSKQPITKIILEASLEIRGAIIYAVLIDITVLLPILFMSGVSGAFFKPLAFSYALALLASMAVALTVTPVLCLLLLRNVPVERRQSPFLKWLQRGYDKLHRSIMQNPKPGLMVVCVLIIAVLALFPFLSEALFPNFKERSFLIHWVTKPGTGADEVVRITQRLSHALLTTPGVKTFGSHIGRAVQGEEISGINFAENWISIDPKADYQSTIHKIKDVVASYPGLYHDVQTYLNERIDEVVAGASNPIIVRIFGSDLDILRRLSAEIALKLSRLEGTANVHTELQVDVPHIQIKVNLAKAAAYGLKPGDVRRAGSTLIAGTEVSDIHRDAKVYDVMVWSTDKTREDPTRIRDLLISTPDGNAVKLGDVASVTILPTPNLIERENNSRRIDVGLDPAGHDLGDVVRDVKEALTKIKFPLGYHAEVLGEYQEREAAQNRLLLVGIAAAILVFLLLQAAFGNFRLAFLAFFTLPSALIGGIFAIYATNGIISLGSLVGFFTVFGIAARNGIMLINHYQYIEKQEGEPFGPSLVLRGAKERLAPILMTALAAGLALVPLAISGDIPGQEIEYPMAVVILGGLFTSTLLNLFIVPYLYLQFGKPKTS